MILAAQGTLIDSLVTHFAVDALGNVYTLRQSDQLKKRGPKLDSLAVFNDVVQYGRPFHLDVSNPLRIILWYRDFGQILLLDRFLKPTATLDYRLHEMPQVGALAQSFDNKFWMYDEQLVRIKKVSETGNVEMETADFRQLFADPPQPQWLFDLNRQLIAYDSSRGFFVFDYFGTFKMHLPLTGITQLCEAQPELYFLHEGVLKIFSDFDTTKKVATAWPVGFPKSLGFQVSKQWIYWLDRRGYLYRTPIHEKSTAHIINTKP